MGYDTPATAVLPRLRGRIGAKTLSKAPEIFAQDLPTILSELLQNARRAGATAVSITVEKGGTRRFMTLRDNGPGMDDLQKFVTFGESGWSEQIDAGENAAGMGTYCLASRGATVSARGMRAEFTTAVFTGDVETVATPCKAEVGTSISFPLHDQDGGDKQILRQVTKASVHLPLTVTLNGMLLKQSPFLNHAAYIEEFEGVEIGVYDRVAWDERQDANYKAECDYPGVSNHRVSDTRHRTLSFHGHAICIPAEQNLLLFESSNTWHVAYDVKNAPGLRLVLPTRDQLITNDSSVRLMAAARRATLRHIATLAKHTLPMSNVLEARAMGIDMPDPELRLARWNLEQDSWSESDREEVRKWFTLQPSDDRKVVLVDDTDSVETMMLLQCEAALGDEIMILTAKSSLEGLARYDALTRLTSMTATGTTCSGVEVNLDVTANSGELRRKKMATLRQNMGYDKDKVLQATVAAIVVHFETTSANHTKQVRQIPVDALVFSDDTPAIEDLDFVFVSRQSADGSYNHDTVVGVITKSVYNIHSYNVHEDDTGFTEKEFERDLRKQVRKVLATSQDFEMDEADRTIRNMIFDLGMSQNNEKNRGIASIAIVRKDTQEPKRTRYEVTVVHTTGATTTTTF